MDTHKILCRAIHERVQYIMDSAYFPRGVSFFLAGGAIAKDKINDLDIYPIGKDDDLEIGMEAVYSAKRICKSRNATTYGTKPWRIQLCKYRHSTLQELVNSFDFSSIQVGAMIEVEHDDEESGQFGQWFCRDTYYTDAFVEHRLTGNFTFTGSEYPLSSLFRIMKYRSQGVVSVHHAIPATLKILTAIKRRGFRNYDDFKDQLDAVDLMLAPRDFDAVTFPELMDFFTEFEK